ncbi:hypothetical protein L2K70_04645 [Nocardioides KLBMP 9356]|uniref:DUF4926 domain-containing protein n=1 Tax=Nocardioides potassii TaxID=2911371 RepID=A0ABS9HA49_9ACTN|nr:hypothetical protein [Nocardioides potassii]MCF6376883.1 hypothetical protein [Nocardioides potassii]
MALTMRDTYPEHQRPACVITFPDGHDHAGPRQGEIRARLVDDQGDWWFEVQWRNPFHTAHIAAVPVAWCRRPELTDDDGLVTPPPAPVEQAVSLGRDAHADCPRCTTCPSSRTSHCKHAHNTWG